MAGFAFSRREDIEKVLGLIGQSPSRKLAVKEAAPHEKLTPGGVICQTPGGGIGARSGSTVSYAECIPYFINGGELTSFGGTIRVYNIASSVVSGNTYITAKLVGTNWVCDAEDC